MFQVSLKAARINANLTQRQAAAILGIDITTIGKWESGKSSPRASQLKALCEAYSIPVENVALDNKPPAGEQSTA